jgi:hypothetical protein
MLRELVVFNFQEKSGSMREFIKKVTAAAELLQYNASEADIFLEGPYEFTSRYSGAGSVVDQACYISRVKIYSRCD